jgi:hypothetical protein
MVKDHQVVAVSGGQLGARLQTAGVARVELTSAPV